MFTNHQKKNIVMVETRAPFFFIFSWNYPWEEESGPWRGQGSQEREGRRNFSEEAEN